MHSNNNKLACVRKNCVMYAVKPHTGCAPPVYLGMLQFPEKSWISTLLSSSRSSTPTQNASLTSSLERCRLEGSMSPRNATNGVTFMPDCERPLGSCPIMSAWVKPMPISSLHSRKQQSTKDSPTNYRDILMLSRRRHSHQDHVHLLETKLGLCASRHSLSAACNWKCVIRKKSYEKKWNLRERVGYSMENLSWKLQRGTKTLASLGETSGSFFMLGNSPWWDIKHHSAIKKGNSNALPHLEANGNSMSNRLQQPGI